jgi:1-aminocyclopropane-1-carboxylate deaminase
LEFFKIYLIAALKKSVKNSPINLSEIAGSGISLYLKREDEIHPFISGNKYRKLKYNIFKAQELKQTTLLTFGGAFSNHIAAVACVGKEYGFKTIGIIRGEELGENLETTLYQNPTLKTAAEHGMRFDFVSRNAYRLKNTKEFMQDLQAKFGDFYLIPEGGTNALAVKGCEEILKPEDTNFDVVCVSIGTGGTISGVINSLHSHQKVIGFPALKGDFLTQEIEKYIVRNEKWSLNNDFHFGGFAKINVELINFINNFKKETNISLDPIYTGKMMFGIVDLIKKGFFDTGTRILAIHTGGMQGVIGMNLRLKQKQLPLLE